MTSIKDEREAEDAFDARDIFRATQCRGPLNLPVWIPHGVIEELAEHIGVTIMKNARDPQGLKIMAPVQIPDLPDIAREALRRAVGATQVVVDGEPDPGGTIRGFGFGKCA